MSKHTPGLWVTSIFCAANGDDCVGVKSVATFGAVAWVSGSDDDETNANARLIASAPDLLSQLHQCVRYLADLNGSQWINGTDAGSIDMRQRAKALQQLAFAAINKATRGAA